LDLSQEGFVSRLAEHTKDLDIGLVVSNAGTPSPGEFLKLDRRLRNIELTPFRAQENPVPAYETTLT